MGPSDLSGKQEIVLGDDLVWIPDSMLELDFEPHLEFVDFTPIPIDAQCIADLPGLAVIECFFVLGHKMARFLVWMMFSGASWGSPSSFG
jgi:hypothetical protein